MVLGFGAVLAFGATGVGGSGCVTGDTDDPPRMELPLPIPPVLKPTRSDANADYYTITQKPGLQKVFPPGAPNEAPTPIEGYEGIWPGPTIEARRGRETVITQINALNHPVVTHNHGHKVAATSDGHPVDVIQPGGSRDYHYPNDQPAGTFWFHDHTMNATSFNVWQGLSSFYIIRDDVWDGLNLPSGEFDVPLLLQDRAFNADNTFYYPGPAPNTPCPDGADCNIGPQFGDTMCVNGVRTPRFEVASRKYLFRLLNGSDHRIYRLMLRPIHPDLGKDAEAIPFKVVASDGGLLSAPIEKQDLVISPAERYAIVVDFSRFPVGTSLALESFGPDADLPPRFGNGKLAVQLRDVMRFDITRTAEDTSVVPDKLATIERLDPTGIPVTPIELGRADSESIDDAGNWYINRQPFDPARIDIQAKLGNVSVWEINNPTVFAHSIHVHLVQFQVLDGGAGASPPPEWMGWKDSILLRPLTKIRIIMKWEGFSGVYVFHCHMLGHEDHAMMAQVGVRP